MRNVFILLHPRQIVAHEVRANGSATATVTVTVDDVNDNNPLFLQAGYDVSVSENSPNNTHVAVVNVR